MDPSPCVVPWHATADMWLQAGWYCDSDTVAVEALRLRVGKFSKRGAGGCAVHDRESLAAHVREPCVYVGTNSLLCLELSVANVAQSFGVPGWSGGVWYRPVSEGEPLRNAKGAGTSVRALERFAKGAMESKPLVLKHSDMHWEWYEVKPLTD